MEIYNKRISNLKAFTPELAESEDERIRKALIDGVRQIRCKNGITQEQMITYLEKQKDLDKMIIVSPEVWDNAISDAFENGKKEGEKQKEQKPNPSNSVGLEQKPVEPDWCHHKVDLSGHSEEYVKAYYDGWNNCNQQHAQCEAEQKPVDEQFPPLEGLDKIKAKYYDDGFKNGFDEGVESAKSAEWSEKCIADIFEKVGLAKIVREQGNDALINAIQSAMIELSKVRKI